MNGVTVRPLGEVAALQAGVGFPLDLQGRSNGKYPLAKVGDISRGGRSGEAVLSSADHFVDEIDLERLRAKPIPAGSVLFAKIGEAIRQNHRVIAGCPLLIDNNAMAAIPGPEIESRYLYYFLRTVDFYRIASATTVPALRKSELERIGVPLFALPEQRRIAEVLDRAEALRAKRRAALAQLDTLTQSIFLDLFGDPIQNMGGFPVRRLADLVDGTRGISYGVVQRGEAISGGVPLVRIKDVVAGEIAPKNLIRTSEAIAKKYRRTVLRGGELVISIRGTIGRCALVPAELAGGNITRELALIPYADVSSALFILALLRSDSVQKRIGGDVKGIAQRGINLEDLRELPVIQPPKTTIAIFEVTVKTVDKLKSAHRASLAKLDALFASLQHRAFRGEL
jgi:type I restriction enzyme S subunit